MIDLYTWNTPNGRKVSILLEELAIPYKVHAIDITQGDQHRAEFLKLSPNNRIPAIIDNDYNNGEGLALMESGAIMLYLAEKAGALMPKSGEPHWRAMEWLMWQMGGLGPMLGQVHHFVKYNKGKSQYAEKRYFEEAQRLYKVLNKQLEDRSYVAGDYSIADIAIWPWISRFEWQNINLDDYPNVKQWYIAIAQRPAVQKGYHLPFFVNEIPIPD